jgi:hypothetical protein
MSDRSKTAAKASSLGDHKDCPFHDDTRDGLCRALTKSGELCKYRSRVMEPGYFPVCKVHDPRKIPSWQNHLRKALRAGRCQSIEDCGQVCNRLAKETAPYHLCEKHEKGSDSLPCHFMELPTELRLTIYRYLFPAVVPTHHHNVKVGILKTNRQIYQEASSVLYGESQFQVTVKSSSVSFRGKTGSHQPPHKPKPNDCSMDQLFCGTNLNMIRDLEIEVSIGRNNVWPKGVGLSSSSWIENEDYELYALRNSIHKLVDFLSTGRLNTLKSLKVEAKISLGFRWTSAEANVAIFFVLEPLQELQAMHAQLGLEPTIPYEGADDTAVKKLVDLINTADAYAHLRHQWLKALAEPTRMAHRPTVAVRSSLQKVEAFVQLIRTHDASKSSFWTSAMFQELENTLHRARVAYEENDGEMMSKILEAINVRWVNAHRKQQATLCAVADSINAMFEQDENEKEHDADNGNPEDEDRSEVDGGTKPTPRELYPDAYGFTVNQPLEQPCTQWWELRSFDPAPKRSDEGVTVGMGDMRYTISKDGQTWSRLRTPSLIRQLQNERRAGKR